ncbi:UNVERIFIED_CONTAM: Exosome complex exonuclease RRP46 [Sesamum radiatum]|uniref:Exosome complex exonuclease RRP46 n=1 Tax=Sesamum radiatum TaxID=300843 RepID=A0AAW2MJS4_SESRA
MDLEREGGRGANQLRPIDCTRNVLSRAHGSASCSHAAICCCLTESGQIILDPSKLEEQRMKGFVCLAFPSSIQSVLPQGSTDVGGESVGHGVITSLTHGVMPVDDYFQCIEQGRAAITPLSNILKKKLQAQPAIKQSKAG